MAFLLAEKTGGRNNNFQLLRTAAALTVLYFHCYSLLGRENEISLYLRRIGDLPLDIFFILSGFLITASFCNLRSIKQFAIFRILRVIPALIFSMCLCALIIGPFYTRLSLGDYFSHYETYRFLAVNILLVIKPIQFELPGVFIDNPFPVTVNGSIWTLPYEIFLYFSLIVIGALTLIRPTQADDMKKTEKTMGIIFLLIGIPCLIHYALNFEQGFNITRFLGMFYTAAAFYIYREKIRITPKLFFPGLFLVLIFIFYNPPYFRLIYEIYVVYFTLALAYTTTGFLSFYSRLGDYSYGIYIYAFPIQQAFVASIPGIGFYQLFCYSCLTTLILASISWHCIENPVLRNRNRIAAKIKWSGKPLFSH